MLKDIWEILKIKCQRNFSEIVFGIFKSLSKTSDNLCELRLI